LSLYDSVSYKQGNPPEFLSRVTDTPVNLMDPGIEGTVNELDAIGSNRYIVSSPRTKLDNERESLLDLLSSLSASGQPAKEGKTAKKVPIQKEKAANLSAYSSASGEGPERDSVKQFMNTLPEGYGPYKSGKYNSMVVNKLISSIDPNVFGTIKKPKDRPVSVLPEPDFGPAPTAPNPNTS